MRRLFSLVLLFSVLFLLEFLVLFSLVRLVSSHLRLGLLTIVLHLHADNLILFLLIVTLAVNPAGESIVFFIGVRVPLQSGVRSNSDVLSDKVFGSEIVHEVLGRDESAILVVFLHNDLLKLLVHNGHNHLKLECNAVPRSLRSDLPVKLLVNLLDHALAP